VNAGAVHVFRFDPDVAQWVHEAKLTASDGESGDYFGSAVAIETDTIVVGVRNANGSTTETGKIYVFRRSDGAWIEEAILEASDAGLRTRLGSDVAIDGDTIVGGASGHDEQGNFSGAVYVFRFEDGGWVEEQKLLASDGAASDNFGSQVAIVGDTIAVSSPDNDDLYPDVGAVYVFELIDGQWTETRKLIADDREEGDLLGTSLAMGPDLIVAGVPNDNGPIYDEVGSVYLFRREDGIWDHTQPIFAPAGRWNDGFGMSVDTFADLVIAGAPQALSDPESGVAYVFELSYLDQPDCNHNARPDECDIEFGDSEDCNVNGVPDGCDLAGGADHDCNGNQIVDECDIASGFSEDANGNGRPDECDAWCSITQFEPSVITPSMWFGGSVALDGDTAVIGARYDDELDDNAGAAYIFQRVGDLWSRETHLLPIDPVEDTYFGTSVAVSGDWAFVGAPHSSVAGEIPGAVYVYRYIPQNLEWTLETVLHASNAHPGDEFGSPIAVDDNVLIVGATDADGSSPGSGAGYVFRYDEDTGQWLEEAILTDEDGMAPSYFGRAVAVDGDWALVGASGTSNDFGTVYVYRRDAENGTWSQVQKLSGDEPSGRFGSSVAMENGRILIGAPRTDGVAIRSGAVFAYHLVEDTWVEEPFPQPLDLEMDDRFGESLSVSEELAAVGSSWDDFQEESSGSVRVYSLQSDEWTFLNRIYGTWPEHSRFGIAVSMAHGRLLVGEPGATPLHLGGTAYLFNGFDLEDCNANGASDRCDIANGESLDINENGVPDECECLADFDGSDAVGALDLLTLLGAWGPCLNCPEDLNGDGMVNVIDVLAMLAAWGPC
jgi:hypothetical protein